MKRLEGTRTEENLKNSFAGESEARNKYTFFADIARMNGYEQMGDIFEETAHNEKEHAEIWYKLLNGGIIPNTKENLRTAINGENYEATDMYVKYADEARQDGFEDVAILFEKVANIEKEHAERFKKLLNNINEGIVFSRTPDTVWVCMNCGHVHKGDDAPLVCPVCGYPQSYFQIKAENY